MPALALGSYALLLTTLSVVGIRLTEVSIRLAVLALVLALVAMAVKTSKRERSWSAPKEGIAIAALAGVFCVSLAAGWDVVEPFPPPGSTGATTFSTRTRSRRGAVSLRRIHMASANLAGSPATPASVPSTAAS